MVGEYSCVALATVELPRDLAYVRGSIVADATVKTFHAHHGLMVFEQLIQQQRRGGFSPPNFPGNGCGRGKPAPTLLLPLIFKRHKPTAKFKAPRCGGERRAIG